MKLYRIKPAAPPHYVQGRGILGPGDTFHAAEPLSVHVEEVPEESAPAESEPADKPTKGKAK